MFLTPLPIHVINVHMATSHRTNNFGTDGTMVRVMEGLTLSARTAFDNWMVTNANVQAAASSLDEATFGVWMENNVETLLRKFERATR